MSDYPWIPKRLPLELRMVPCKASWFYAKWLQRRNERSHKHQYHELALGPRAQHLCGTECCIVSLRFAMAVDRSSLDALLGPIFEQIN